MIKNNLILFFFFSGFLIPVTLNAQQDAQFTHYMYNTLVVNPAYAGSRQALTIGALYRKQWEGIEGAPETESFNIHSPSTNEKFGAGLSAMNQKIGPVNQTIINIDFAYITKLSSTTTLSFGLKAGANIFHQQFNSIQTTTLADPAFINANNTDSKTPQLGFGFYIKNKKYYFGGSALKLTENKLTIGKDKSYFPINESRNYYFIGGLVAPIIETINLKPSMQIKFGENTPLAIDLSLEAILRDKISIGFSNRVNESISLLAGYFINEQLKAGIAYDFTLGKLQHFNSGSFEIMIMYDFIYKRSGIKSPRYF